MHRLLLLLAVTLLVAAGCPDPIEEVPPGTLLDDDDAADDDDAVDDDDAADDDDATDDDDDVPVWDTDLVPLYPGTEYWGDWVRADGTGPLDASGEACPEDVAHIDDCMHAGVLRAYDFGGGDCADVTAEDTAEAFDWTCVDGDEGPRVVSTGLRVDARLHDLLDGDEGWADLSVAVFRNGTEIARSEPGRWWLNPVARLEPGAEVSLLDTPRGVYVVDSGETAGLRIDADQVSVVLPTPGALDFAPEADVNCDASDGEASTPDARCVLASAGHARLWIEGALDAEGSDQAIHLGAGAPLVLRSVLVEGGGTGVVLSDGSVAHVEALEIDGFAAGGMFVDGCDGVRLHDVMVSDVEGDGLEVDGSAHGTFEAVSVQGSGGVGVRSRGGLNHRWTDIDVVGTTEQGVKITADVGSIWRMVSVVDAAQEGFTIAGGADGNRFIGLFVQATEDEGIEVRDSSDNAFLGLRLGGTGDDGDDGMLLARAHGSAVVDAVIGSSGNHGLNVEDSLDVVGTGLLLVSNGADGLHVTDGAAGGTFTHVTAAANDRHGAELANGAGALDALVSASAFVGNGEDGLTAEFSAGLTVHDVASWANGDDNVDLDDMTGASFFGTLWLGAAGGDDCDVDGDASDSGLEDETCEPSGASTATVVQGVDLGEDFVGPVRIDDPANSSDTDGAAPAGTGFDWLAFDAPLRAWAIDADWPSEDLPGDCDDGEDCRIFDWRLSDAAVGLLDAFGAAGNVVCPGVPDGDAVLTDAASTPRIFLAHAVEVGDDGIGDDDGLCETDETCTYAPNVGAYQGEPSRLPCDVGPGVVTNTTVLSPSVNGVP